MFEGRMSCFEYGIIEPREVEYPLKKLMHPLSVSKSYIKLERSIKSIHVLESMKNET